jgi:DNA-directed RNA polymerase alpha subunit
MSLKNFDTDVFNNSTFTLENIDVSLANAIRRTIINDIETWVFVTSPEEKNRSVFHANTTRMHNELLKQRLSSIPINVKYQFQDTIDLNEYYLEVEVENNTNAIIQVTTQHFIVKKKSDGKAVSHDINRDIFPPYISPNAEDSEEYYTLFVYLRPKISEEIPGEKIHFTCDFSVSCAKENAMFNVTSTCCYGNTIDEEKAEKVLEKKISEWREEGLTQDVIDIEVANWRLLDMKRVFKPDSFDFTIQSVGVFSNDNLMLLALKKLVDRTNVLIKKLVDGQVEIAQSLSTMAHSFDIVFEDDYTIGKVLEFMLSKKIKENMLLYCGYSKNHPHDIESVIRIAFHPRFAEKITTEMITTMLQDTLYESIAIFTDLSKVFVKTR